MPALPTIPGLEGSGIVEKVRPQVTQVRPGQPVIVFHPHCYAEYVLADSQTVFPNYYRIRYTENLASLFDDAKCSNKLRLGVFTNAVSIGLLLRRIGSPANHVSRFREASSPPPPKCR